MAAISPLTRGERVCAFIERYLRIPEGALVGQPMRLLKFQRKFILDIYDNPAKTRKAILSVGRKNGKTAIIAAILLAHIVGPEAKLNTQIISGARSRDQAALVFELACKMINQSPELQDITRIIPSSKKIIGLRMNVEYKAISAEGKTAHGLSPILAILDEVGQVEGSQDSFVDAIVTAQGAHADPLLICISTQAANDGDLLSIWIDDALQSKDPKIVCHLYAADDGAELMDEEQWHKANPALGEFRSMDDMREQMREASRLPSRENVVRNLLLNQRVSLSSPFISRNTWEACIGDIVRPQDCEVLYGGLDLSAKKDLTSLVLLGRHDDKWHVFPYFWTPKPTLIERAKADRVPYDYWVSAGHIYATSGATVDYGDVAQVLSDLMEDCSLVSIAFDRYRMEMLQRELDAMGVSPPLVEFGQGFKSMTPAVDKLEGMILNGQIVHNDNPVMNMCIANTRIVKNAAGDRKIEKERCNGRIDGVIAMVMAAGIIDTGGGVDIDAWLERPMLL